MQARAYNIYKKVLFWLKNGKFSFFCFQLSLFFSNFACPIMCLDERNSRFYIIAGDDMDGGV